jgi:hypothetical protein
MLQYKLSYLDPRGREVGRFEFQCSTDEEAQLACEDLADPHMKALWCGQRLIKTWMPTRVMPPPDTLTRDRTG